MSAQPDVVGRPFEPMEFFTAGELVTLAQPWQRFTTDSPMVVLADKGRRVNVTLLGGDGDRYVRVDRRQLVRRDVKWLTEQLRKPDPLALQSTAAPRKRRSRAR